MLRFRDLISDRLLLIWLAVGALLGLICRTIPILAAVDYEFALCFALFASICSGTLAVRFSQKNRAALLNSEAGQGALWGMGELTLLSAFLSLLPLGAGLLFAVAWNLSCPIRYGLGFFALLPVVSAFYASAWGCLLCLLIPGRKSAHAAMAILILGSVLWEVHRFVSQPVTFAYNPFFGFFPGPIYDSVVVIEPPLIYYRLVNLGFAGLLVCLGRFVWAARINRAQDRTDGGVFAGVGIGTVILTIVFCVGLALAHYWRVDLGYGMDRRAIQAELSERAESEHFRFFYPENERIAREIEFIIEDHEFRYSQNREILGSDFPGMIDTYIYKSKGQKKRLMGAGPTMYADVSNAELHMHTRPFPHSVLKHELLHAMSRPFGIPYLRLSILVGMVEGLAVSVEGHRGDLTIHQWARAMKLLNKAPDLAAVMTPAGFWREAPARAYLLSGSFVLYLRERYGIDKVLTAYPWGSFSSAFGKDLDQLVPEWESFLETVVVTQAQLNKAEERLARKSIFDRRCARAVARLLHRADALYSMGRSKSALLLYERAAGYQPENPSILMDLAWTHFKLRDFEECRRIAGEVACDQTVAPAKRAYAHLLLGDAAYLENEIDTALAEYAEVISLDASDSLTRGAACRRAALDAAEASGPLMDVFVRDRSSDFVRLRESLEARPGFAVGWYVLGRRFYFKGENRLAVRTLASAADLGLPHDLLTYECLRLLGLAQYKLRNPDRAEQAFERMRNMNLSPGKVMEAEDLLERAAWLRGRLAEDG